MKLLRYIYLLFLIATIHLKVLAQHSITKYEYRWAFFHPFAAFKIKKKLPEAMLVYKDVERKKVLDTLAFGGKLDAFRHTYTMAYLARTLSEKKLRKLGKAHEKGNKLNFFKNKKEFAERADSLACEMDLKNNEIGFLVGIKNKKASDEELKQLVLSEIKNGSTTYLKRNQNFIYVRCDDTPINLDDYKGKWYVPKCLIKTNE